MANSNQDTIAELKKRFAPETRAKPPPAKRPTSPKSPVPVPAARKSFMPEGKEKKPPPLPAPKSIRNKNGIEKADSGGSSMRPVVHTLPRASDSKAPLWEEQLKEQLVLVAAEKRQLESSSVGKSSDKPPLKKLPSEPRSTTESPKPVRRSKSSEDPPPLPSSPIPGIDTSNMKVQKIILKRPEHSNLDLTEVDIQALTAAKAHPSYQCYQQQLKQLETKPPLEDLKDMPLGKPHWQDDLRKHLTVEDETEPVRKGKKRRPLSFFKFSKKSNVEEESSDEQPPNIAMMDLDECDGNTDLDRLVFHQSLPRLVKVDENFFTPGCSLFLEKGGFLMIHLCVPQWRIHALDPDGKELWLHVHSKLRFDRLPLDPRHDNKTYVGTTALAEAKPLPSWVRVIAAHCVPDPMQMAEVDDIVQISHVEMGKDDQGNPQKVVVGKIGEQFVNLGEDLNYAEYTTMLSEDFIPMSELVKFDFPQRVRVVDTEAQIRNPKKEMHLKLLSFDKEYHVICTQPSKKRVISIPMTCPVRLSPVSGDWETCRKALPPIYPLMNYTWNAFDLGRPDLPDHYRQIAQPIPAVLHDWMISYEGKNVSVEVADRYVKGLNNKLEDLKRETRFHRSRLSIPDDSSPLPLPPRVPGSGEQPPSRPPKPDKKGNASPSLQRSKSDGSGFRAHKPRKQPLDDSDYEDIDIHIDEEGYVTPKSLAEKKTKEDPLEEATINELKNLLEKKEEDIRNAKIRDDFQEKKVKLLTKENEDLLKKTKEYGSSIQRLQIELDHALMRADMAGDNVYDSIVPPQMEGGNEQIYNSPIELRGVKVMSTADVSDLLRELHLSQYIETFEKEQVDGNLLETLDEGILKGDLGMSGLHARKVTNAVNKRKLPGGM